MEQSEVMLMAMALMFGLQHGFDLDHLSIVDSITRNVQNRQSLSKVTGVLFSLGHGLVVTVISIIVGTGLMHTEPPPWLDDFGNRLSTLFLLIFGTLTLWNVLQSSKKRVVSINVKLWLSKKIMNGKASPVLILLTGALFAFSFDTFSQVTLFSISASLLAGWIFSGLLGIVFMFGMMISDGLNGLLVSLLLQRADNISSLISRLTGLGIAFFSLGIALMNIVK